MSNVVKWIEAIPKNSCLHFSMTSELDSPKTKTLRVVKSVVSTWNNNNYVIWVEINKNTRTLMQHPSLSCFLFSYRRLSHVFKELHASLRILHCLLKTQSPNHILSCPTFVSKLRLLLPTFSGRKNRFFFYSTKLNSNN